MIFRTLINTEMGDLNFYDQMAVNNTGYEEIYDPLGLLAYRRYRLKRGVLGEETEQLDEALTIQQRMKRKMLMRRIAPRIARARKLAMRRRAGTDVLKRRAKALARRTLAKKFLGGRSKSEVGYAEKIRIEKLLAKRQSTIDRLAVKLLPVVRKKQAERFAAKGAAKNKTAPTPTAV